MLMANRTSVRVNLQELVAANTTTAITPASNATRSNLFTVGLNPQTPTDRSLGAPDLTRVELLKDGLDNPYAEIHWQIPRFDVDAGGVVGFEVYRRRLSREEIIREFRDRSRRLLNFDHVAIDKLARSIPRRGKFFYDRKSIYQAKRGSIPLSILNPNLYAEMADRQARYESVAVGGPFLG
jgi:hypothetical protein